MTKEQISDKISALQERFSELSKGRETLLREIALAEIPEMVYNSNAIENSTLSLAETEKIIHLGVVPRSLDIREVNEAQNLARITKELLDDPDRQLTVPALLARHKILLTNIRDDWAGRFRQGTEWVRVGGHIGANPDFTSGLVSELIAKYNADTASWFLDKIAWFHAEFEKIHPFNDGNGRIGRVLINWQLLNSNLPPIIIQNNNKQTEYYPLFAQYPTTLKFDGFTSLFSLLLMEALHKRIAYLEGAPLVPLPLWARNNSIHPTAAAKSAKRQSIPAFRLRGKWLIPQSYGHS
ncbi:MAG: Fic family protein [Puniceicoccales bacterium]|nr:Fic family protein [Puniceicoccales bacterium]